MLEDRPETNRKSDQAKNQTHQATFWVLLIPVLTFSPGYFTTSRAPLKVHVLTLQFDPRDPG